MKVTIYHGGQELTFEGPEADIRAAIDEAIRRDEAFYKLCVDVVGHYVSERVAKEMQEMEAKAAAAKTPATRKYTTKGKVRRMKN